jgi:hypothetical protein
MSALCFGFEYLDADWGVKRRADSHLGDGFLVVDAFDCLGT